jgi:hypothetical protein
VKKNTPLDAKTFAASQLPRQKSPREQVSDRIAWFIEERPETFNAPYGVLCGLDRLPRGGAVRTITFGCARTLDATLFVWGPTRITLQSSQGNEEFTSEEAVYDWLRQLTGERS